MVAHHAFVFDFNTSNRYIYKTLLVLLFLDKEVSEKFCASSWYSFFSIKSANETHLFKYSLQYKKEKETGLIS